MATDRQQGRNAPSLLATRPHTKTISVSRADALLNSSSPVCTATDKHTNPDPRERSSSQSSLAIPPSKSRVRCGAPCHEGISIFCERARSISLRAPSFLSSGRSTHHCEKVLPRREAVPDLSPFDLSPSASLSGVSARALCGCVFARAPRCEMGRRACSI